MICSSTVVPVIEGQLKSSVTGSATSLGAESMARYKCGRWILVAGLIGFACTSFMSLRADGNKELEAKGLFLQFELDKHSSVSGDTIQYRASLPSDRKVVAQSMSFHVERVGVFHRGLGRLVHLDDPLTTDADVQRVFDDLPSSETGSHGLEFNFHDEVEFRHGMAGAFQTLKVGRYLVWTEWQMRVPNGNLKSNTVYLEVQPRNDSNGKPIIDDKSCSGDDLEEQVRLEVTFDGLRASWAQKREQSPN